MIPATPKNNPPLALTRVLAKRVLEENPPPSFFNYYSVTGVLEGSIISEPLRWLTYYYSAGISSEGDLVAQNLSQNVSYARNGVSQFIKNYYAENPPEDLPSAIRDRQFFRTYF